MTSAALLGSAAIAGGQGVRQPASATDSPEARAVRYLAEEVPRWRREHPCYSCHNNGDAARALLAAIRRGHAIAPAMDETLAWLGRPERWDENAQGGGIDDKPLARIQFAGALTSAVEAGLAQRAALGTAAASVATDQGEDGAWRLDSSQSVGSPTTYGTVLATWAARRTLTAAGGPALATAIARADRWLRAFDPKSVLDASATVLALAQATDEAGRARRASALDLLVRGQGPDGGWGLYATSPSEPFDTAVAVLALSAVLEKIVLEKVGPSFSSGAGAGAVSGAGVGAGVGARVDADSGGAASVDRSRTAISRGRGYLIEKQLSDGSWPETTRPSGQESYAQRISTTGWATLALLATQ
jgi:hypothetical protein